MTPTNLDKLLQEIQARCEKATPGPWKLDKDDDVITVKRNEAGMHQLIAGSYSMYPMDRDAEFIAASRSDIPRLLAIVGVLNDAVEKLRPITSENHWAANLANEALDRTEELAKG